MCPPVEYAARRAGPSRLRGVIRTDELSHVARPSHIPQDAVYEDQYEGREYIPDYEVAYDEDFGTMYNGDYRVHDDDHFPQGSSS